MHLSRLLSAPLLLLLPMPLLAATYTVGPSGRDYTQLSALVDAVNLEPGDIVLVDGGATYNGNVVVRSGDRGAAGNPVTFRWNRSVGSTRPILQGGSHTIKFQQSNHVVFEGFDVRGGTSSCVFSEAHDVTVRDSIIRDCPSHGILGADNNSGSFTLEYSEVFNSGAGTHRHPIYMQSDQVAYPGSVFLMRFNYVHSGNGGSLLKNRHERALIYYNWFEGSAYQELELIGPDCETQQSGWSPNLRREDVDLVGNVIIHTSSWRNAIRAGGDLNGRSQGRLRMVNNTILFARSGIANAVLVQLGLDSIEMHNNVIHQTGAGAAPNIVRVHEASEVETPYCAPTSREPWSSGRKVAGSNNWVQSSATLVPSELTSTRRGTDPLFTDIGQRQLRPLANSPLVSSGNASPPTPPGFPFPSPLALPQFDPPMRAKMAIGAEVQRQRGAGLEIGALESSAASGAPTPRNGSAPLLPPAVPPSSTAPTPAPVQAGASSPEPAAAIDAGIPAATRPPSEPSTTAPAVVRHEAVRITPPILRMWSKLSRWFDEIAERDARASR